MDRAFFASISLISVGKKGKAFPKLPTASGWHFRYSAKLSPSEELSSSEKLSPSEDSFPSEQTFPSEDSFPSEQTSPSEDSFPSEQSSPSKKLIRLSPSEWAESTQASARGVLGEDIPYSRINFSPPHKYCLQAG